MIEASIYTWLSTTDSITSHTGQHIYRAVMPQGLNLASASPVLVWSLVDNEHSEDLSGCDGVVEGRLQLDIYSYDLSEVLNLAEDIRLKLQGFSGTMGTDAVLWASLDAERSLDEWDEDTHKLISRKTIDYILSYRVTIPGQAS